MTDVKSQFLRDISDHRVKVIKDKGVYRHIRFSRPNSSAYRFDILTHPHHLMITGDCGTYVFSRVTDMFSFFSQETLTINAGYWGQKLLAICKQGGYRQFSSTVFEQRVREHFEQAAEAYTDDQKRDIWDSIEGDVLSHADDSTYAYAAIVDFNYGGFQFQDFFDAGATDEYTHHYLWCLYAIVWGIQQYDDLKKSTQGTNDA